MGLDHAAPLHIGVDLDGCPFDYVANITAFIIDEQRTSSMENADFIALVQRTPADNWHWYRAYMTDEEFVAANKRAAEAGWLYRGPVEPGWVEVLTELREAGHFIHIVTARFEGGEGPTAEWLKRHHVPYDALTFTKDKSRLGLDVLIDDRHENIRDWVASGKYGILYDQPWNQHSNTGAIRAFNPEHVRAAVGSVAAWVAAGTQADDFVTDGIEVDVADARNETILEEAQRLVHGDRGSDYGHPWFDFRRTAAMLTGMFVDRLVEGESFGPRDVPLIMQAVKISREVNSPKRDNRVDGAGYWETLDMVDEFERGNS